MLKTCEIIFNQAQDRLKQSDFDGMYVIVEAINFCGAEESDCRHKPDCVMKIQKLVQAAEAQKNTTNANISLTSPLRSVEIYR